MLHLSNDLSNEARGMAGVSQQKVARRFTVPS